MVSLKLGMVIGGYRGRLAAFAGVVVATLAAFAGTAAAADFAPSLEGEKPAVSVRDGNQRVAGGYYPYASTAPWVTSIESSAGGPMHGFADRGRPRPHRRSLRGRQPPIPSDWTVRVGVRDRNDPSQGETRGVSAIVVHPQASLPNNGIHLNHAFYDLAVMFLDSPVSTAPAVLGTSGDWADTGTALGWGHYNLDHANPQYDSRLKAINLTMGDDDYCSFLSTGNDGVQHYFSAIHACGYDYEGNDCITHGDSGGPLVVNSGGTLKQIGVTSFFPSKYSWGPCGYISMIGFAWVAGPTLRDWPLTVSKPSSGPTGQRAAAVKKCKRKFRRGSPKRRRCIRRARQLPV